MIKGLLVMHQVPAETVAGAKVRTQSPPRQEYLPETCVALRIVVFSKLASEKISLCYESLET